MDLSRTRTPNNYRGWGHGRWTSQAWPAQTSQLQPVQTSQPRTTNSRNTSNACFQYGQVGHFTQNFPNRQRTNANLIDLDVKEGNREQYTQDVMPLGLSCTILYLYSLTICTIGPFLPDYDFLYWTYMLSRYLAAVLCSLTFLIRIAFTCHHCLIPWLISILYLAHVSQFCSNMYDLFCCLLYIWLRICQHITALLCRLLMLTHPHTSQWLLL